MNEQILLLLRMVYHHLTESKGSVFSRICCKDIALFLELQQISLFSLKITTNKLVGKNTAHQVDIFAP